MHEAAEGGQERRTPFLSVPQLLVLAGGGRLCEDETCIGNRVSGFFVV